MDKVKDQNKDNSELKKLKAIKRLKRKQWMARKKEKARAANAQEKKDKLLKKYSTEISELQAKNCITRADAATQAHLRAHSVSTRPANFRGRQMVNAALQRVHKEHKKKKDIPLVQSGKKNKQAASDQKTELKELDPTLITRIEESKPLGQGTYGCCFLAKYRGLVVAVKEYLDNDGQKKLPDLQKAARHEASMILKLGDHKGLPFLFGVCIKQKPIKIVLLYHGDHNTNLTLYDATKANPLMDIKTWYDIFGMVADALQHVHIRGIIHNDLKSNNVVLEKLGDARYNPVIIDFGCSVEESLAKRRSPRLNFRDHYIAPEVMKGSAPPTVSSDVYSFGKMVTFVSERCKLHLPRLVYKCLSDDANKRPSLLHIKASFKI